MKNSQKGFAPIIILVVIALAAIGGGTYYYSQKEKTPAPKHEVQQSATTTTDSHTSVGTTNTQATTPTSVKEEVKVAVKVPVSTKVDCGVSTKFNAKSPGETSPSEIASDATFGCLGKHINDCSAANAVIKNQGSDYSFEVSGTANECKISVVGVSGTNFLVGKKATCSVPQFKSLLTKVAAAQGVDISKPAVLAAQMYVTATVFMSGSNYMAPEIKAACN